MAHIVLFGATSAIATEIAINYAREGTHRLLLVGRDSDKLGQLANQLGDCVAGTLSADFNNTQEAEPLIEQIIQHLSTIDIAIFAHGYLGNQLESEVNFDHAFQIIQSNYLSVVALLIPLIRQLQKQDNAKIGVMLSVAGDRGRPRNFTYGSAKGALNLYLQGLRSSLWGSGIEIYSFKLGPVDTPMTRDHVKNFSFSDKRTVARKIIAALNKRQYNHYIPGYWFWVMWVVRSLPEPLFQKLAFLSNR